MNAETSNKVHPLFPGAEVKASYRIREVARFTGFSRQSIHKAIDRGELVVIKQGPRTYRIPLEALRNYLNNRVFDPFF